MRANEFTVEGPVDAAGDWMQKQVIGRKQKDQAAAQKQNTPKVAKLIQQQIAAKFDAMIAKNKEHVIDNLDDILTDLVTGILKKATKVTASNKDVYGEGIPNIVDSIKADPTNIETSNSVHSLLSDVITKSFAAAPSYSNENLIKTLRAKVKKMKPEEARQFVLAYAKKAGHNEKAANQIADEVLGDLEDETDEEGMLKNFVADVFYMDGRFDPKKEGTQKAYVNREGKWSIWIMGSRNIWDFKTAADDEESEAIETLIHGKGVKPVTRVFNQADGYRYELK